MAARISKIKNRKLAFAFIIILAIAAIALKFVHSEISYCCEKTTYGAWCQNAPLSQCDNNYRKVPTSCEATSYCKLGCCYDSQEGVCMKNTPEKICEDSGGVWNSNSKCEIPMCQMGCCILGDQAAFVTQTRCKRLSSLYGLETNYRTDISNEIECLATASSKEKGACVFNKEFERTCVLTTQEECYKMSSSGNGSSVEFHKDFLCSDETLGTNCGPTEKTTCVEGKDEVYFVDSCGNIANIYDSSKIHDKTYWSKIIRKDKACNPNNGNANSKTCGNCDYFLGSTCKEYKRGEATKPYYGNYLCKDLSCEYNGKKYKHGESWCAKSPGTEQNLPGSRYFRLVCYDGEVTVEPCADYRQEYCIESNINGFKSAACIVNKWQPCASLKTKEDCEDLDKGDCVWKDNSKSSIKCFPKYPPGLQFWGSGDNDSESTDAQDICSQGTVKCVVKYEKKLIGGWKCVENCECLTDFWRNKMAENCRALGDCGEDKNYLGF